MTNSTTRDQITSNSKLGAKIQSAAQRCAVLLPNQAHTLEPIQCRKLGRWTATTLGLLALIACSNECDDTAYEPPPPPINGGELQPYQWIMDNPESFFVPQGLATCGGASFYMIFKYYQDHQHPAGYFFEEGCVGSVDLEETIPEESCPNLGVCTLEMDSKMWEWLAGSKTYLLFSDLVNGAMNLYHEDNGNCEQYYDLVGSNRDDISYNPWSSSATPNVEKWEMLNEIYSHFLSKGLPVIVHLHRDWSAGHYVVLVGYDPEEGLVYIVDPIREPDEPELLIAPAKDFIMNKWYTSESNNEAARWSGRWLGFGHDTTDTD